MSAKLNPDRETRSPEMKEAAVWRVSNCRRLFLPPPVDVGPPPVGVLEIDPCSTGMMVSAVGYSVGKEVITLNITF
jgi:hypothetical protein